MALEDPENEGPPLPVPQTLPTPPGAPAPIGGLPVPMGGGGHGGGGGGAFNLPGLPNYNQIPGAPGFTAPQFRAPDAGSLTSDPGYLARLDASSRALERSAAARGSLRTGGTLNDIMELGQNFASQEYAGAYQRALATHDAAMRSAQAQYAPQLESWRLRNEGLAGSIGAGYNAQLQHALDQSRPRGGGGGGGDELYQLLPYLLGGDDGPPQYPGGI